MGFLKGIMKFFSQDRKNNSSQELINKYEKEISRLQDIIKRQNQNEIPQTKQEETQQKIYEEKPLQAREEAHREKQAELERMAREERERKAREERERKAREERERKAREERERKAIEERKQNARKENEQKITRQSSNRRVQEKAESLYKYDDILTAEKNNDSRLMEFLVSENSAQVLKYFTHAIKLDHSHVIKFMLQNKHMVDLYFNKLHPFKLNLSENMLDLMLADFEDRPSYDDLRYLYTTNKFQFGRLTNKLRDHNQVFDFREVRLRSDEDDRIWNILLEKGIVKYRNTARLQQWKEREESVRRVQAEAERNAIIRERKAQEEAQRAAQQRDEHETRMIEELQAVKSNTERLSKQIDSAYNNESYTKRKENIKNIKQKNAWRGLGRTLLHEKQYLKETRTIIKKNIRAIESRLSYSSRKENGLGGGDEWADYHLGKIMSEKIPVLESIVDVPYVGRVDFETSNKEPETIYIGKQGVQDEENSKVLVISWTSSIASLFYQKKLGSNDTAAQGIVDVKLIRQIELKNGISYFDLEVENRAEYFDPMLHDRLNSKSSDKMKDIVATIQAEQDAILRLPKNNPILIQGSAGSGKTTIALHRLAYLFYEDRGIDPRRLLILGPNQIFMKYVSQVLPDLGVDRVSQNTFQDWAIEQLNIEKLTITSPYETMRIIENSDPQVSKRFALQAKMKGSMLFMEVLNKYLHDYEESCLPENGIKIPLSEDKWYEVPYQELKRMFLTDYNYLPISRRRLTIISKIEHSLMRTAKETDIVDVTHIKAGIAELKRTWRMKSEIELYYALMSDSKNDKYFVEMMDPLFYDFFCKYHQYLWENKEIDYDDLSPLLYIKQYMTGELGYKEQVSKQEFKYSKYQYVIIDEGQDWSPFQLEMMKTVTNPGAIMLLGDLGQSIFAFRAIEAWSELQEQLEGVSYIELMTSYRSTVEITKFSNRLIEPWSQGRYNLSLPTMRIGQEPRIMIKNNERDWLYELRAIINKAIARDYKNIAVIARSDSEAKYIQSVLNMQSVKLLLDPEEDYRGGIIITPAYLSKGIEYDVVIIADVSEEKYIDSHSDRKLLYVGCTRALHELYLLVNGKISPLLEQLQLSSLQAEDKSGT